MKWSEEQLTDYQRRRGLPTAQTMNMLPAAPIAAAGRLALGRLKTGEMNKTEAAYAGHLEMQRGIGAVLWWKFEGIKLRLADNTFLTVDFAVLPADGILTMDEIKGHWMDDARVKIKVAASIYPFRFRALKAKRGGGYDVEEF